MLLSLLPSLLGNSLLVLGVLTPLLGEVGLPDRLGLLRNRLGSLYVREDHGHGQDGESGHQACDYLARPAPLGLYTLLLVLSARAEEPDGGVAQHPCVRGGEALRIP